MGEEEEFVKGVTDNWKGTKVEEDETTEGDYTALDKRLLEHVPKRACYNPFVGWKQVDEFKQGI